MYLDDLINTEEQDFIISNKIYKKISIDQMQELISKLDTTDFKSYDNKKLYILSILLRYDECFKLIMSYKKYSGHSESVIRSINKKIQKLENTYSELDMSLDNNIISQLCSAIVIKIQHKDDLFSFINYIEEHSVKYSKFPFKVEYDVLGDDRPLTEIFQDILKRTGYRTYFSGNVDNIAEETDNLKKLYLKCGILKEGVYHKQSINNRESKALQRLFHEIRKEVVNISNKEEFLANVEIMKAYDIKLSIAIKSKLFKVSSSSDRIEDTPKEHKDITNREKEQLDTIQNTNRIVNNSINKVSNMENILVDIQTRTLFYNKDHLEVDTSKSDQLIRDTTNQNVRINSNNKITVDKTNKKVIESRIKDIGEYHQDKEIPRRKQVSVNLVTRRNDIVRSLKKLYNYTCQICQAKLEIGSSSYYIEAHHIKPLGKHGGPDTISNLIIVCPNCHTLFDRGAIGISKDNKVIHFSLYNKLNGKEIVMKHKIDTEYIDYHNKHIFIGQQFVSGNISDNNVIKYGDCVKIRILDTNEDIEVAIESKPNSCLMTKLQQQLLGLKMNEDFIFLNNKYKVIAILHD